jgi:hypothetical protein
MPLSLPRTGLKLTTEAHQPGQIKPKRKSPRRALELRARIKELALAGKTPIQTAKILGKTKQAVFLHLKNLVADGELRQDQTNYEKAGPPEERKWYKIIERANKEQRFYDAQRIVPTARKVIYRLLELAVAARRSGASDDELERQGLPIVPDPDVDEDGYKKAKHSFSTNYYGHSADARRGIDSTYTKPSYLPKMRIDCYRDGRNLTPIIGETDIGDEPKQPTADTPPEDPIEFTEDVIDSAKSSVMEYTGECEQGDEAVMPGIWWNQPTQCRIWCESDTIQPDLKKFQSELPVTEELDDWHIRVVTTKGMPSVPTVYDMLMEIQRIADGYEFVKKFVILYFGDGDEDGKKIANTIENAIDWYRSGDSPDLHVTVEVEFRPIALTEEHAKKYKLTGNQLEAFLTTKKRLKQFKEEVLLPALQGYWDEDVYYENCPDEEYDYETYGEEEPQSIDPDNDTCGDIYEDADEPDLIIREKMAKMLTEAFKPGWEKEYEDSTN